MRREVDGNGVMIRRYVPLPGPDETLAMYDSTGVSYPLADSRGTPMAWTLANGQIAVQQYGAFGEEGPANIGRFGFTGHFCVGADRTTPHARRYDPRVRLPEIGLDYYKARFYDPQIGRFLTPDPAGYIDSPNLYAYVLNDPINFTDPSGLTLVCEFYDGELVGCRLTTPFPLLFSFPIDLGGGGRRDGGGGGALPPDPELGMEEGPGTGEESQRTQPSVICQVVGAIFGGGNGTAQVGLAGTGQLGPGAVTGGGGLVVDRYGNIGLYSYGGVGAGTGAYIGGGASGQISNADGIGNLRDFFVNASGSGGLGPSASADFFLPAHQTMVLLSVAASR